MISPGSGYEGYLNLTDILEKCSKESAFLHKEMIIQIISNHMYINNRQLQGINILGKYAIITGIHYTTWENATQIRSTKRIEPSLDDPFVYLSEPGMMNGWPEKQVRKALGAASAEAEVKFTITVPVERIWIKISGAVAHYAIAGIIPKRQISKLIIQRRKAW